MTVFQYTKEKVYGSEGAAIENSMSNEIFSQLQSDVLTNAANLTNDDQIASLCNWLIMI